MKQPILLWLDDYRNPFDSEVDWMVFSPIGRAVDTVWVKSYNEFVAYIEKNGLPDGICFDHDLGDGKDGISCVNWLIEYCLDNDVDFPSVGFQTANPVGKENMSAKINNFRKSRLCQHIDMI